MEPTKSTTSVASDVLHFENQSKLSAEEIAKAVAHHKRHHGGNQPKNVPGKMAAGAKNMGAKSK